MNINRIKKVIAKINRSFFTIEFFFIKYNKKIKPIMRTNELKKYPWAIKKELM